MKLKARFLFIAIIMVIFSSSIFSTEKTESEETADKYDKNEMVDLRIKGALK